VREITYEIDFGWLIRSAHSWSANLMVAAVFVHMFSVFFMKAYRKPREFGWWSGLALLGLTMLFGFSGYLLPMDELAYFATKVGLDIPKALPGMAPIIENLVQGGTEVTGVTIQRFFALHAVILPLVFIAMLGFHLWLVQRHGNAVPPLRGGQARGGARGHPVLPELPDERLCDVAHHAERGGDPGESLSLALGSTGGSAGGRAAGHSPRVVFHEPVPAAEDHRAWVPGMAGEYLGIGLFAAGGVLWALDPALRHAHHAGQARAPRDLVWVGRSAWTSAADRLGYVDVGAAGAA
jgi:cytochrome b6